MREARVTLGLLLAFAPLAFGPGLQAQEHQHGDDLGSVSFPVTCNAEAQTRMSRAVAMLHSFWYSAGEKAFRDIDDRLRRAQMVNTFLAGAPRMVIEAGKLDCAGEVIPLAHAFQTLVGTGLVLGPDGSVRDAGAALAAVLVRQRDFVVDPVPVHS